MTKRLLAYFVLCIFLAHFAGFYIYFAVQLKQVRKEMRAKLKELPPEELDLIILSTAEYQSAKVEESEIKVDGNLYDIAWVEINDDNILVHCLHDAAEDNLIAFLDKILSQPLKDKNVPTGVLQFWSLNFLPSSWNFFTPEFQAERSFTLYAGIVSQFNSAEITPPPRV